MGRFGIIVLLLLTSGCGRPDRDAPLSRETFIDVIVALREANREAPDAASFEMRKQEILEQADVTDSALVQFARRNADDVAFMAAAWDSIARRLRASDTVRVE